MKLAQKWQRLFKNLNGYDPCAGAEEFLFDAKEGQAAIDFFELFLCHVEGDKAGEKFKLETWQKASIACLFGWKRKSDGMRRYRRFFLYVPRKNGKTPLAAGIVLKMLLADGEIGATIMGTAGDKEQARLLFRHAAGMAESCPELADMVKIMRGFAVIERKDDPGSIYKCVTARADTKHGGNPHAVIIDELHIANAELVDVMRTSMASANRKQPMLVYVTTADYARESACNEVYKFAKRVHENPTLDHTFLPIIYEAAKDDDWTDPKTWKRANPNLGVSVSLDYIEQACKNAQEVTSQENSFRRLHLNQQTESARRWLSLSSWDACRVDTMPDLRGRPCWGGLDLASTRDLSALVLVFPDEDDENGAYTVLPYCWLPADTIDLRTRKDNVPYRAWASSKHVETTPGNTTDYGHILNRIRSLREEYQIMELAVDPWQALSLMQQLDEDGVPVVKMQQTCRSMSPGIKKLEELILAKRLQHSGHPVLRWCVGNSVAYTNSMGHTKLDRMKSSEKIDLAVSLGMAVGRAMIGGGGEIESVYEDRGLLVL